MTLVALLHAHFLDACTAHKHLTPSTKNSRTAVLYVRVAAMLCNCKCVHCVLSVAVMDPD
jgi:hypothetical protein